MPWTLPVTVDDKTYPLEFEKEPSQEDIDYAVGQLTQAHNDQPSEFGSLGRGMLRSAAPAFLGGRFGGMAGAALGGALEGALAGSEVPVVGNIVGGLVGAGLGMYGASKLQSQAADVINPSASNPFSTASEQADIATNPKASELGGLLLFKPNPVSALNAVKNIATSEGRQLFAKGFQLQKAISGMTEAEAAQAMAQPGAKEALSTFNSAVGTTGNIGLGAGMAAAQGQDPEHILLAAAEGALFNDHWLGGGEAHPLAQNGTEAIQSHPEVEQVNKAIEQTQEVAPLTTAVLETQVKPLVEAKAEQELSKPAEQPKLEETKENAPEEIPQEITPQSETPPVVPAEPELRAPVGEPEPLREGESPAKGPEEVLAPETAPEASDGENETSPESDAPNAPEATKAAKEGSPESFAMNEVSREAQRKAHGLPDIPKDAPQEVKESFDRISSDIQSGKVKPDELIQSLEDHPRTLNHEEVATLAHEQITIENGLRDSQNVLDNPDATPEQKANAQVAHEDFTERLNKLHSIAQKSGSEWGRTGRWMQERMKLDYSLERVLKRARANKGGKDLTSKEVSELTKLTDAYKKSQEELERLQAEKAKNNQKSTGEAVAKIQKSKGKRITREDIEAKLRQFKQSKPEKSIKASLPERRTITPEQDKAYLDAVERGDTETAQKMVDGAAKKAGYRIPAYRMGTVENGKLPEPSKAASFGKAYYFAVDDANLTKSDLDQFRVAGRGTLQRFFLKLRNPINSFHEWQQELGKVKDVTDRKAELARMTGNREGGEDYYNILRNTLNDLYVKSGSRDGVLIDWKNDPAWGGSSSRSFKEVALFRPENAKSADPITRDSSGRVIPLSERFNPESSDIRYSRGEEGGLPEVEAKHQNQAVQELKQTEIGRKILRDSIIVKNWQDALAHPELSDAKRGEGFTGNEINTIKEAEGFFDPVTGKSVAIRENIRTREGETPIQAVKRVLLHERVGHDGVEAMRQLDPKFDKEYHKIVSQIPEEKLSKIAETYKGADRDLLIKEWIARQAEKLDPNEIPDPKTVFGKLWQAIKDFLSRYLGKSTKLDQEVRDLIGQVVRSHEALESRRGFGDVMASEGERKPGMQRVSLGGSKLVEEKPFDFESELSKFSPEARKELEERINIMRDSAEEGDDVSSQEWLKDSLEQAIQDVDDLGSDQGGALKEPTFLGDLPSPKAERLKWQKIRNEILKKGNEIKFSLPEEKPSDHPFSQLPHSILEDIARYHVQEGLEHSGTDKAVHELASKIRETLEPHFPGVTEEDIHKAFSRYGKKIPATKDEVQKELDDLRGQSRLYSQYIDASKGLRPELTGKQRNKPSQAYRDLEKKVKDEMEKQGFRMRTEGEERASKLDARISRLNNDIEDVQKQVDKLKSLKPGETFEERQKSPRKEYPETKELEDKLKSLKDEKEELIKERQQPAPEPGDYFEEISRKLDTTNKRIAELEVKEKSGDYSVDEKEQSPSHPLLDAARNRVKELNQSLAKMRSEAGRPERERIALEKQIKEANDAATEIEGRIARGELKPEPKKPSKPVHPDLQAARDRLAKANKEMASKRVESERPAKEAEKLQNQIDEAQGKIAQLEAKLLSGDISKNPAKRKPVDAELASLREQIKGLNKGLSKARSDAEKPAREAAAAAKELQSAKDHVFDLEKRLAEGNLDTEKKPSRPVSPELQAERDKAAELNKQITEAKKQRDSQTPLSPDEWQKAIDRRLKSIQDRTKELDERLKSGKFDKAPKKEPVTNPEIEKALVQLGRKKVDIENALYKHNQDNRTTNQKFWDNLVKGKRAFILSSLTVFPKLAAAVQARVFTTTAENLVNKGLTKVLPKGLTEKAPLESSSNVSQYAKAYGNALKNWFKDAKDIWRTGLTDIDAAHGKYKGMKEEGLDSLLGRLHYVMKAPAKRAAFEDAVQTLAEAKIQDKIKTGQPPDLDTVDMADIYTKAYKAAERSIFQQDNDFVKAFRAMTAVLEKGGAGAKGTARALKILFPIVKVPSNMLAESLQYAGGVPIGLTKLAKVWKNGFENLKPEEAEIIMRQLKKGSVGSALMTLGFLASSAFGGFFQEHERRKLGEPKAGGAKIAGIDIPSWLMHSPAFEILQMGSTIRRVADSHTPEGDDKGIPSGILAALFGVAEETPFMNEALRLSNLQSSEGRSKWLGDLTKAQIEPQLLQQAAKLSDPEQSRESKGFVDDLKMGVPGLREQLPVKVVNFLPPSDKGKAPPAIEKYALAGGPVPSAPSRQELRKKNPSMTESQFMRYAESRGRYIRTMLLNDIPNIQSLPKESQELAVHAISADASKRAKSELKLN